MKERDHPAFRAIFSPFFHINPTLSFHQKIWVFVRTVFCCIFLLPLRLLCILVSLTIFLLLVRLLSHGLKSEVPPKMELRRRIVLFISKYGIRVALFFCGFHWISVKGRVEAKQIEAQMAKLKGFRLPAVVATHMSWQDILILACQGYFSFISTAELAKNPIVGACAKAWGVVFVDRFSKTSREEVAQTLQMRVATPGPLPLIVFPEGVTHNGLQVLPFKEGIFRTGGAIQPICLRYPHKYWNPVYTESGFIGQFLRTLTQIHNRAALTYLPPHLPTSEEVADPSLYANRIRAKMADALHVPLGEVTVGDRRLFQKVWFGRMTAREALEEHATLAKEGGHSAHPTPRVRESGTHS